MKKFLYEHPELAYHEKESSQEIVRILRDFGYEVEYPFLEKELGYDTAFQGILKNGEGPSIAIMVEYDALPDLGHACGHNLSGALSLLSALAFTELKNEFKGTIYVIGTPAEEEDGAKCTMADLGVFDNMALSSMAHSWSGPYSYPQMDVLSLRCHIIEFFGTEAHAAASPWDGNNALTCARKCLDLIDARRECFTSDLRVNAIMTDGGKSPNILPKYASLRLELRAGSKIRLEETDDMVKKCARGAAMALDCDVTFKPGLSDFLDMVRPMVLEDTILTLMRDTDLAAAQTQPAAGSSDVGNVSYHCPTVQMLLSITDDCLSLHTPKMREATMKDKAEERLFQGACVLTELSLKMLTDTAFRQQTQAEFHQAVQNKTKK